MQSVLVFFGHFKQVLRTLKVMKIFGFCITVQISFWRAICKNCRKCFALLHSSSTSIWHEEKDYLHKKYLRQSSAIHNFKDYYYASQKQAKATWRLRSLVRSIILANLLRKRSLFKRVQKVIVCHWWLLDLDPFCAFMCFEVRCLHDRNYDWRQRKTQSWRRIVNFRVMTISGRKNGFAQTCSL